MGFVTALEPGSWVLLSCGHDERVIAMAAQRDLCAKCGADVTRDLLQCRCVRIGGVIFVRDVARAELEEKARRRLIVNPVLVRVAEVVQLPGWMSKVEVAIPADDHIGDIEAPK